MTDYSPIAVFVYNRADKTKGLIESLLRNPISSESDLYVFSDGPKKGQEEKVNAVREYLETVTGFKSVNIIKAERNKGLAASIISGVTKVVNEYGRVIVLEDDLVCSNHLLEFMNEALIRYKDEKKVYSISGYSHLKEEYKTGVDDFYFLPIISSWGWATWADRWECFDPKAEGYKKLKKDKELNDRFNFDYIFSEMLLWQMEQHTIKGFFQRKLLRKPAINSWAIRWYWSVFCRSGLNLYPKNSLIENNGFDGSGTNCGTGKNDIQIIDDGHGFNLPNDILVIEEVCDRVKKCIGK